MHFAAFPNLQATIEDLIAEGDKVAARLTWRGTHKGEFEGVPPTGHMAVAVSSGRERLLHVGDAPGHFVLSLEHPDWYLAVDLNPELALRTRRQLFDWAANRSMVFAYHFPFPGVGYVTKNKAKDEWEWEAFEWKRQDKPDSTAPHGLTHTRVGGV